LNSTFFQSSKPSQPECFGFLGVCTEANPAYSLNRTFLSPWNSISRIIPNDLTSNFCHSLSHFVSSAVTVNNGQVVAVNGQTAAPTRNGWSFFFESSNGESIVAFVFVQFDCFSINVVVRESISGILTTSGVVFSLVTLAFFLFGVLVAVVTPMLCCKGQKSADAQSEADEEAARPINSKGKGKGRWTTKASQPVAK
jgi:hypothetical protein